MNPLYRLLLRLYPTQFREEYGGEMSRLLRDRIRREGAFRVWFEVIPDLIVTAWKEHMDILRRDILYGLRNLVRAPGFSAVAIATLALGIGANTAIFSVVKGVLLDPLPYRDSARLVELYEKRPEQGRVRNVVSPPDFYDWKKQNTVFEDMAALSGEAFNLTGSNGAELILGASVSPGFFRLLGVQPQLGRDFLPEEGTLGKDRVVILNHGLWQRRFGADPAIIGRKITLSGTPYVVIGVLPEIDNIFRPQSELWTPLALPSVPRGFHMLDVIARMKPGVTLAKTRAEMDAIASRLEQQYPNENTGHGVNVFALDEEIVGKIRPALFILLGAVGLVLLIACANVANLYLARTAQRRREIAVRTALGAGTLRLARQLLTESILLSLIGGAAGVALAWWGVHALIAADPGNLPRLREVDVDAQVLLFALAASVITGALFGLVPTLYGALSRLAGTLKEVGRSSTGAMGRSRTRAALVMSEIAVALVLAIGAGLMLQSFSRLAQVNPGFNPTNVLAADIALLSPKYKEAHVRTIFFEDLLGRLRSLPGVQSAGGTIALPLSGADMGSNFLIQGRPPLPYSQQPNARYRVVMPGYFETMQIPLRAGRFITGRDTETAPPVVLVNETLARQFWPNENAVGKRIALSREEAWREVVGVVSDVKHYSLDGETRPAIYLPLEQQAANAMSIVLRTATPPESLANAVRSELARLDPDQPIARMRTLEDLLSSSVARPRFYAALLAIFSLVSLLLAAVGIYGVMSFAVGQRTHEMGVRIALGASPGAVQRMVLREGMLFALVGAGLGIAGAFALTGVLRNFLYGITATDGMTFVGATLLTIGIATTACLLPARRATRADPMEALRSE